MTRRHDSKISAIFWGLVYCLPFIMLLFSFIAYIQPFSDSSVFNLENISLFLEDGISTFTACFSVVTPFLAEFFPFIVIADIPSPIAGLLLILVSYYITVHLLRLVVDVILFIPHLFHSWISKFDRKVE